jgi:hypothetical protein
MADKVLSNGLILTDWADNMAQQQANAYAQFQRQASADEYRKKVAVDNAGNLARQQYAQGNMTAARDTAAQGNAWDVWKSIDDTQKAQVAAQASDIGGAAYNLARLPKGQARVDYFNAFVPTLRSHGMSDAEIAQYANSGFLDNDDALHGYADKAIGIKELYDADQARIKREYDRESDLMKPVTAADGAVLTRGQDGSYQAVYTPGTKPMQEILKNEDGSYSYVNVPGTAGNSYAPGSGDTSRLMNYQARAAGVAAIPDNVRTVGQFSDFGIGLNQRGVKSSAAGTYQITAGTYREFAPKVLGAGWRDAPISAATEDAVARAIYESTGGDPAKLRGRWTSLSMSEARALRGKSWEEARGVIAAGESGGSAPQGPGPRVNPNSGIQVQNLGGGRAGPEWQDETRQINGQMISGQRNQKTGEFRPLGGAAKPGKPVDYDSDIQSLTNTIGITEKLYHHPGLSAVVGVPGITGGLLGGKVIPGTNAAGFTSLMKNFDANAYLSQVTKMKGMGALSDAEGARLSAAIGSLSTSQSESEFKDNLAGVRRDLELARSRLIAKRNATRSGGQPQGQAQTRVVNGRTYVKVAGGWRAQ